MRVTRRALLAAAVSGLVTQAAGRWGHGSVLVASQGLPFASLARAWLARGGNPARALAFVDGIAAESARAGRAPGRLLDERRSADFTAGKTVVLDGWIFAEAEALYAAGTFVRHAGRA